ncbi:DMT family transporter [Herbiconiux moechotypicola]|uniref:EamA family transporter n=1 Tax=Herbiconiux moechotypicola TaxID=637393 RepID=A0ABN3DQC0_9MICO|nr:DMT family transporter [Herbiconiux moechotypicola]MCS5731758.1 DMT family transporter [Herbiconiux moechotypicola]
MEATWRWALVTAIAPVAWGSNYFVTRHLLPADEPLWGAVFRALPAGLLLLLLARERPHGSWWWKSLVLGTLNVGAFFVLIYLASQLLPTSIASTVMASSAGVLLLIAWPLLGERPRLLPALGAAVGFAGVVLMLAPGAAGGAAAIDPVGVAVSLLAMCLSSVGFVLTKRWGADVRVLPLTAWQLLAGSAVLIPVAAVFSGPPPVPDGTELLGFAYVSLVATAAAFLAWFAGLRRLPAASVGLIGLLNPVTGVLLGTLVAGEHFGPAQLAGTVLVLGGVLLGQRRTKAGVSAPIASSTRRRSRSTSAPPAPTPDDAAPPSPAPTPRR